MDMLEKKEGQVVLQQAIRRKILSLLLTEQIPDSILESDGYASQLEVYEVARRQVVHTKGTRKGGMALIS